MPELIIQGSAGPEVKPLWDLRFACGDDVKSIGAAPDPCPCHSPPAAAEGLEELLAKKAAESEARKSFSADDWTAKEEDPNELSRSSSAMAILSADTTLVVVGWVGGR